MEAIHSKTQAQGATDQSMRNLQPGRSFAPPEHDLKASSAFLKGSIGRGGENQPTDLRKLATFLYRNGVPRQLLRQIIDPARSGDVIARYQREVLGFGQGDGRIDPGGKTIAAILDQRGKDIVAGWYGKKEEGNKEKVDEGKSKSVSPQPVSQQIKPVLSESQYFSQYNQGAPCVPLSLLKKNLGKRSTERAYRNVGCYQTCRYMLMQARHSPGSKSDASYLLEMATNGAKAGKGFEKRIAGMTENFASSLSDLDQSLMAGKPVIVGVNKNTKNHTWTNTKTDGEASPTDHFVVIVGKVVTAEGQAAYRYFDPGRYSVAAGTSTSNLLIQNDSGQFTGNAYKNHVYSLAEIRAV